ncbi:DHS-like NAD/FAD-binding domain-containing protein [Poronia punctata]|nr:DHS-like NAD/FAD-binding domain-containing protein [Poronia punctata]
MPPKTSIPEFQHLLSSSSSPHTTPKILALCGAGLSAASGLPTFRGTGGLWRNHEPTSLATPTAFLKDPALVWLFYAWRKHMALNARPNNGHWALAELGRKLMMMTNADGEGGGGGAGGVGGRFLCLTQNVDGLHQRASHPESTLRLLHGSILDMRCFDCDYIQRNNLSDPICPALAPASSSSSSTSSSPLLDPSIPIPEIDISELPHCPECKTSLLRPGVVWFGEALDNDMLDEVDDWIEKEDEKIDFMLVIGTAAVVYPAAGYVGEARERGAVVVVVNPDEDAGAGLGDGDFFFRASADEVLPLLFEPIIGKPEEYVK